MKRVSKIIAILLAFVLIVCAVSTEERTEAQILKPSNKQIFTIGKNTSVSLEETSTGREVHYYFDGKLIQSAYYEYNTGKVTCCSYDKQSQLSGMQEYKSPRIIDKSQSSIQEYTLSKVDKSQSGTLFEKSFLPARGANYFTLLKSKTVYIDGIPHQRQLSGYTDQKEYIGGGFFFEHGTEISLITAIIGFLTPALIGFIASGASTIASALSVRWTVVEYYWKYMFRQTSPTYMDFICSNDFAYRKDRKVEENGVLLSPETYYVKSSSEIEYERNDILNYPGFYS
ncbi:MAG: hypothetical protein J5739_03800 [Lachnospiraceae bacterium]|nr:hypothetical protein [Lachnospiraceae bacterium]